MHQRVADSRMFIYLLLVPGALRDSLQSDPLRHIRSRRPFVLCEVVHWGKALRSSPHFRANLHVNTMVTSMTIPMTAPVSIVTEIGSVELLQVLDARSRI